MNHLHPSAAIQREVKDILVEYPETRDGDNVKLFLRVLYCFHKEKFLDLLNANSYEEFETCFKRIPRFDSITRYRRGFYKEYPLPKHKQEENRQAQENSKIDWSTRRSLFA